VRSRELDLGGKVRCGFIGYTIRVNPCGTIRDVSPPSHRLNITLDPEHAARLARLAERTHVHEGTLARSLLSMAIEDADPEARNVTTLLDGIPNALERAQAGLDRGLAGETVALDEL
jgi:predicted transcriptional regulator